ncbi:hypothetical protein HYU11_04365 [Candidatus Woesearchaeota archaeon]|nr:hypothetical protein [Candidatus Woesearchaeota archaeon]
MASKKEAKPIADNSQLGNWALWLGLLVSMLSIVNYNLPFKSLMLLVLGAVGGYMLIPEKDTNQFIMYTLAFFLGLRALDGLSEISSLSGVVIAMNNLFTLFSAAALVVAMRGLGKVVGLLK